MNKNLILACTVTLVAACSAPITKQEQQSLAQPVNCATAPGDLRVLENEKASTAKMMAEGVSAVFPIGLVVNVAQGQEGQAAKVATGQYNQMIENKIALIKATCNL